MPVTFGGVYLIRGNSLNEGYDPQVERALRRIREEAQKRDVDVAAIRLKRAGIPSVENKGYVTREVRAVFTAEDATAAQPLIDQINGKVGKFRSGKISQTEMNAYIGWWRDLKAIVSERGATSVNTVNRELTRKRFDVVNGPATEEIPYEVFKPSIAKSHVHASRHEDPPAREPALLVRAFSWLKERLS